MGVFCGHVAFSCSFWVLLSLCTCTCCSLTSLREGLDWKKKCIPILDVDNLHVQLPDTNIYIYINYLEGCRLVIYGYGPVMNNFCSHKL